MMRSDILKTLFDQRDLISDMIINLSPQNPSELGQLQTLMKRRDRITGAINEVIAAKFNEAASGLADKVSDLEKKTDQLKKLGNTIDDVKSWIKVADEIIQLVVAILALAASA